MRFNTILSIGCFNAALAIVLSAFAAHGLQHSLDQNHLQTFKTACDFHFWHAIGLILLGLATESISTRSASLIAWLFQIGIVLFCGSLYLLSTTAISWLGWITPFGGITFIIAWTWFGIQGLKDKP